MPKIFDCFLFFNELDLLDIRLHELDPVVDHFVICEAPVTFKGKPKPLFFSESRERFERFLKKVINVVVDDTPNGREGKTLYWKRQKFQRNAICRGLVDAESDDFVLLSDLDEIPRASAVESIARNVTGPAVFSLLLADRRYFVNLVNAKRESPWPKGRMARRGDIRRMETLRAGGPTWWPNHPKVLHTMRQWKRMSFGMRRLRRWIAVPDGGWHFSCMNGPQAVSQKFEAVSATRPVSHTSAEAIAVQIRNALESAARPEGNHRVVELDGSFPAHLVANRERFGHLIADDKVFERYGIIPQRVPAG